MHAGVLAALALGLSALLYLRRAKTGAAGVFARVPGPSSASLFAGSYGEFLNSPALETTRQWVRTYGRTLRFKGLFGVRSFAASRDKPGDHMTHRPIVCSLRILSPSLTS